MLHLTRAQANNLSDQWRDHSLDVTSGTYLVIFKQQTSQKTYPVIPVIQSSTARSVQFAITEGAALPTTGSVILPAGHYDYDVYLQDSTTNLDPDDATVIGHVKHGIAVVFAANTTPGYAPGETHTPAYHG